MTIDERSLDEAIQHAREVAKYKRKKLDECNKKNNYACKFCTEIRTCKEVAEEQEQLSEWLEELKEYKKNSNICPMCDTYCSYLAEEFENGYNKSIDDFVKEICKMIVQSENNGNYRFYAVEIKQAIADLAEHLKVG